jgi:hypothetical protein
MDILGFSGSQKIGYFQKGLLEKGYQKGLLEKGYQKGLLTNWLFSKRFIN